MASELGVFQGPTSPPLVEWNIAQLLDIQRKAYGNSLAVSVSWQKTRWTYSELHEAIRQLAAAFLDKGLLPGDRVLLLASNSIEYIQTFLAVASIGATVVIANATFTSPEIVEAINLSEPKIIVIARRIGFRNNNRLLQSLAKDTRSQLVFIGDQCSDYGPAISFNDLLKTKTDLDLLDRHWGDVSSGEVCCFQFTSGTTGPRKASMLSHRNLINNARFVAERLQLSEEDTLSSPPPLFHCFGLVCGLLASIASGSTASFPSAVFDPAAVLKSWTEEHCTVVNAVPAMFQSLLDTHQASSGSSKSSYSLRAGIIAGASLSGTLLQQLHQRFDLKGLIYPFGMTELSAVSLSTTLEHSLISDWSTVGTPLPHTSVKVVDEKGNTLPPGQPGELCVSGYLVHQGYYRAPEKSSEILSVDAVGQVWLHTGDLVSLSDDGRCIILGRAKDLIKKGGENIMPKDIEQILIGHEDITVASVVGIPDPRWGEVVVAFLQPSSPQLPLTSRDMKALLRKHELAPHKMPDHYVFVGQGHGTPNTIPINASGKVLKNELKHIGEGLLLGRKVV